MNENITKYIMLAQDEHKQIMEILRVIIHETIKECNENIKWGRPVFSLRNDILYIKAEKNYVTLGFFNYHKIINHANLLEGIGKNLRHIKT